MSIILFPIITALTVLEAYEVNVRLVENPLIGTPKAPGASRVRLEESERKPTELPGFFRGVGEKLMSKESAAHRHANATSEAQRLEPGTQSSAACYIYSANVTVSSKQELIQGLKHAIKKEPPKKSSFQLVFVSILLVSNVVLCLT